MGPSGGLTANRTDFLCDCAVFRIDSRLIGSIPERAKPGLIAAAKKENLAGGRIEITDAMVAFHKK